MFKLCSRTSVRRSRQLQSVLRRHAATGAATLKYNVRMDDLQFVLHDVVKIEDHYKKLGYKDVDKENIDMLVGECAKFCEQELAPLYQSGDAEGCKRNDDGTVTTPSGWKEAYDSFREAGWQGLSVLEKYGGQGMPQSLGMIKSELLGTANWAWGMYPGLALGAANTLYLHASEQQKQTYLTKLAEGTWLGTMCLTEPHCGTDLGQMTTKAELNDDGSYNITGTKIFISCGEHSWTDNIIHIVLARLPGAPEGTKGISLFIVPKYLPNEDGSLSDKRNIECGGIEHKMGIHGSSTCTMNFDNAKGFLIGKPHNGLKYMFTFMNTARVGTAIQGISACEMAYQNSAQYAKERMSSRAMGGVTYPNEKADFIIAHGDVRRMLLTQRAYAEGGRAMLYEAAAIADGIYLPGATEAEIKSVENWLGLFTPVLKGFLTEVGQEAASLGMQTWGGHGYIVENGMEQIYRDARIATLYEGTTGIQALDLLGRKVLLNKGALIRKRSAHMSKYCLGIMTSNSPLSPIFKKAAKIQYLIGELNVLTGRLMLQASKDKEVVSSAAYDFLMYNGYLQMGYQWLKMADTATNLLASGKGSASKEFYETKLQVADFYFANILPKTKSHATSMLAGPKTVTSIPDSQF